MADVVRWAVACSSGTPWTGEQLIADYAAMQADTAIVTVESDDVGHAIVAWARNNLVEAPFIGTATELHRQLTIHTDESIHRRREWPSNGQQLVSALKRLAPALRKTGITYERHRSGKQGTRVITIKCTPPDEAPTPDGVGGTSIDPDPCSACGKRMNLWWHVEQGIWVCTCVSHPRHPMSANWLKNIRPLPGEPIPSITIPDNSFSRLV